MELKVKEGIKIEIHNRDYARGYYYVEDDWDIKAVASTYEKAIELIIPKYIKSNIHPSDTCVSNVKYVVYNNKKHIIYDSDEISSIYKEVAVINDIRKHPLFKKLSEEKQRKLEIAKIKKQMETKKKKEEDERKLFEKLKKKYGK